MQDLMLLLQDTINNNIDIDLAIGEIETAIAESDCKSEILPIYRAIQAYRENKTLDMFGHLRQCMMYFKSSLDITEDMYKQMLEYKNLFGFVFSNDNKTVNIEPSILPEDSKLASTYEFKKMRKNHPTFGDGRLYGYYNFSSYNSFSQKMLMYMISNMQKNETLLACLPTGGGKSLTWQLPAISRMYQGVIIVVVPTIALAIDHERSSKIAYDKILDATEYPLAYYSGIDTEKKIKIYNGIENGTLPILYISPEALLHKEFRNKVFTAAEEGKISALFIDEAHLIVNWGVRFRPEFQLLSSFRNTLREKCENGLKTVLLSATYTEEDTEIIKTIFADENFTEYRADELRSEPSFYLKKCESEDERIDLVNKLVSQAPKPIIVYTVGPDEGKKYFKAIQKLGYSNVEMFTGETKNDKREEIIKHWNENKLDIIVATSAFGMGVDKADVRTIITAYTPENISRFYQEVGRAGRDGYSSLNYFLPFDEIDKEYVSSLTKGLVLKVSSLVERWKELLINAKRETPDTVWIDINVPPEHLKHTIIGKRNAGWNKDVVLLLFRSGLIDIIDVENTNDSDYKILVHLKNIRVLENPTSLEKYITKYREDERTRITDGIDSVRQLLLSEKKDCFSSYFVNEFPYTEKICNGCPYCNRQGLSSFYNKGRIAINSTRTDYTKTYELTSSDMFDIFVKASKSLMLSTNYELSDNEIKNAISFLISRNVNIVIVKDIAEATDLLESLSYFDSYKYMLLTLEEAKEVEIKWLNGVCAAFYTNDKEYNEQLYTYLCQYADANEENKVIHIAMADQYIYSENKMLSELIDQNLEGEQYFGGII